MKGKKARILRTAPPRDKLEVTGTQNYCRSAKLLFNSALNILEVHTFLCTVTIQFQMSVLFNLVLIQKLPLKEPQKQRHEFLQAEISSASGTPEGCA